MRRSTVHGFVPGIIFHIRHTAAVSHTVITDQSARRVRGVRPTRHDDTHGVSPFILSIKIPSAYVHGGVQKTAAPASFDSAAADQPPPPEGATYSGTSRILLCSSRATPPARRGTRRKKMRQHAEARPPYARARTLVPAHHPPPRLLRHVLFAPAALQMPGIGPAVGREAGPAVPHRLAEDLALHPAPLPGERLQRAEHAARRRRERDAAQERRQHAPAALASEMALSSSLPGSRTHSRAAARRGWACWHQRSSSSRR